MKKGFASQTCMAVKENGVKSRDLWAIEHDKQNFDHRKQRSDYFNKCTKDAKHHGRYPEETLVCSFAKQHWGNVTSNFAYLHLGISPV